MLILTLIGPPGSGKTVIAAEIAAHLKSVGILVTCDDEDFVDPYDVTSDPFHTARLAALAERTAQAGGQLQLHVVTSQNQSKGPAAPL